MRSLLPFALLACSSLAAAAPDDVATRVAFEDAQYARLVEAKRQVDGHAAAEALPTYDAILRAYADRYGDPARYLDVRTVDEGAAASALAPARGDVAIIDTHWSDAMYMRAFTLVELERLDEAERQVRAAIALAPTNSRYRSELGHLLQSRRDWNGAHASFVEAEHHAQFSDESEQLQDITRAKRGQGFQLIELGRLDEAAKRFRECLALDPDDTGARNELAYIDGLRRKAK